MWGAGRRGGMFTIALFSKAKMKTKQMLIDS